MLESDGGKAGFERALERLRDLIDDLEWNQESKVQQGSFGNAMFRHVESKVWK
jgi:hypothetical protein